MNSMKNFVFFLVSGMAFFVVACGDNPEKRRTFQDVSSSVQPTMNGAHYISASGNNFKVAEQGKDVDFQVALYGQVMSLSFDPESAQLKMVSRVGSGEEFILNNSQVSDGFQPLLKIWEDFKEANSTMSPRDLRSNSPFRWPEEFKIVCYETRKGTMEAVYKRPQDMKVEYSHYDVKNLFDQHGDAGWVISFNVSQGNKNYQTSQTLSEESPFSPYLSEPVMQNKMSEVCAQRDGYDNRFQSFFLNRSSTYYGGTAGGINYLVPIAKLSNSLFEIAGTFAGSLNKIDGGIFSSGEHIVDMEEKMKSILKKKYRSGQLVVGSFDPNTNSNLVQSFDRYQQTIEFDLVQKTLEMSNMAGSEPCKYDLKGDLSKTYYSTRRLGLYENSISMDWTLRSVDLSNQGCSAAMKNLEVGTPVTLQISTRRDDGREIHIYLLESNGKKELLSRQSLIEN